MQQTEEGIREEIRRVFNAVDTDGNGVITASEVKGLMVQLLKGRQPSTQEVQLAVQQMDKNKDGVIELDEFLEAMSDWLSTSNTPSEGMKSPQQRLSLEGSKSNLVGRKRLHEDISDFFSQFQARPDAAALREKILSRPASATTKMDISLWRLGFSVISQEEKADLLSKVTEFKVRFRDVLMALYATDGAVCLTAVQACREVLSLTEKFHEPHERFEIAYELMEIYEMMTMPPLVTEVRSDGTPYAPVAHRLCALLDPAFPVELQEESCEALYYYLLGPRVPHLQKSNHWHPSQMFAKQVAMPQQVLLRLKTIIQAEGHGSVSLLGKSIAAVGAFAEFNQDALDAALSLGFLPTILRFVKPGIVPELERKCTYTVSVLCGHTHEGLKNIPPTAEMKAILETLWPLLQTVSDEGVTCNVVLSLRYLLPISTEIPPHLIQRLIELLSIQWPTLQGGKFAVVSILQCLHDVFIAHPDICVVAVRQSALCQIMEAHLDLGDDMDEIKSCTLLLLDEMVHQHLYDEVLMDQFHFIRQLIHLVQHSKVEVELHAMRVLWGLTHGSPTQISQLVEKGAGRAFFLALLRFKQHDDVLADVYGFLGPSFNIELVWLATKCLSNIIAAGELMRSTQQDEHPFLAIFGEDEIDKISQLHRVMCQEIQKNRLSTNQDVRDLSERLKQLLNQIDGIFKTSKVPMAQSLHQSLVELLRSWDKMLETARQAQSAAETMDVEVTSQGLPSPFVQSTGPNIRLKTIPLWGDQFQKDVRILPVPITATLLELRNYLTTWYGTAIEIQYEQQSEKITVSSQAELTQLLNSNPPENLLTVFLLAKRPIVGRAGTTAVSPVKLGPRDFELKKLRAQGVTLNGQLLTDIYDYFKKLNVGSLNFEQFKDGMKIKTGLSDTQLLEVFAAFDINKDGSLTLSELACGLAVMVDGSLEDRIGYAFMAFDENGNGTLDFQEVVQMVMVTTGYAAEVAQTVATEVFRKADTDHSGTLDLKEFQQAVMHNQIMLSTFWTNGIAGLGNTANNLNRFNMAQGNGYGLKSTQGKGSFVSFYDYRGQRKDKKSKDLEMKDLPPMPSLNRSDGGVYGFSWKDGPPLTKLPGAINFSRHDSV